MIKAHYEHGFWWNKTLIEIIKENVILVLMVFILVLMVNGTEKRGNNLMNLKIMIKIILAEIIMMLMWINIKSIVEHL